MKILIGIAIGIVIGVFVKPVGTWLKKAVVHFKNRGKKT